MGVSDQLSGAYGCGALSEGVCGDRVWKMWKYWGRRSESGFFVCGEWGCCQSLPGEGLDRYGEWTGEW